MNKLLTLTFVIIAFSMSGCSHYSEKKAPCGNKKTASLSTNPCNPVPINVARADAYSASKDRS